MSFRPKFEIRQKFDIERLEEWRKQVLSRFFYQAPCGAKSGFHESLPSFLQRLAQKHAVPNGPFFLREVHPQPVPSSGSLLGRHSRCLLVGDGYAEQVARKVARECSEKDVLRLIHGPLSQHVALFRDVRPVVAWCPSCLAEWTREQKEIYRPLLWSLNTVKVCPRHKVVLQDRCPHCSSTFYHFGSKVWSADCPECGKGLQDGKREYKRSGFDVFAAEAVCDLLSWGWQCRVEDFPPGKFKLNIRQANDSVGGEYSLSAITGLSRPAIHAWRTEDRRPSLQGLVHLSYSFKMPIRRWLSDVLTTNDFDSCKPRTIPATSLSRRHPSLNEVRRGIFAYLGDAAAVPLSLTGLARQLETSSYRLYRDCPELAAQVVGRYAEYKSKQKAKTQEGREAAVRQAIHDLREKGKSVSRHAVLGLLKERGAKSSWILKQIVTDEFHKQQRLVPVLR